MSQDSMLNVTRAGGILDLLVVGAGPTGIAIGAAAKKAGLSALLVDSGPLCSAIKDFPTGMLFFTTRDKLEIAGIPLSIPDEKPTRRQALAYYQGVTRAYDLDLALYEKVLDVQPGAANTFVVRTRRRDGQEHERRAAAVAIATGYFYQPNLLNVPGEDLPWVSERYYEPFGHYGQHVVVVGGGNSAAEAALDLWRNNVRVTLVHHREEVKPSIKYWLKPDIENRISEGSIDGYFETRVEAFAEDGPSRQVILNQRGERRVLEADAVYTLIGYLPDADLQRRCGVEVDPTTLVPSHDPETCESNVPGLYIAGTLQAGRNTGKIFIENSRDHGERIVSHLVARRRTPLAV